MNIYVVDEEKIVVRVLCDFLSDLGYEVFPFYSVSELLKSEPAEPSSVDLIIIDLGRLSQDGAIEVIRSTHERYPDTDIVIMSTVLPYNEAISQRVYSYLRKPFRLEELELLLARLTQSRGKKIPKKLG